MAAERKKDKQKTSAELAAEQTEADEKDSAAEEKPKRTRRPSGKGAEPKAAGGAGKDAKPTKTPPRAEGEGETAAAEAGQKPRARAGERRRRPTARRAAAEPRERGSRPDERPVVRAQAKYVRSSARKARLVIDHIRGKSIHDARALLRHTPRAVARDLEKLLESAIANAENNHELVGDDLWVKDCHADEGPTIRRFRPRARGRATRIRKRTSHLTLTLTPKE